MQRQRLITAGGVLLMLSAAVCGMIFTAARAQAQEPDDPASSGTILDFFHTADSVSEVPPPVDELTIQCTKQIRNRWVTFIGNKNQKNVFIAAVTMERIADLRKELSLTVDFKNLRPVIGKIRSWGYIFDRNHDGKIDYMALIGGAAGFKGDDVPKNFPRRPNTREEAELFISHCKLIFNHWADDNYDGTVDAVVHVDMDPANNWVERRIVARDTRFNGSFGDVWGFRNKITEQRQKVPFSDSRVTYYPIGKSNAGAITRKELGDMTGILQLINDAASRCDVGKSSAVEE